MKNISPKISIIIPVYNASVFLDDFLKSVIHQNVSNNTFEVIFVDNNSTDNSIKIIESYKYQYPNINITCVFYKENQSSYAARNYGVNFAKSKVLAFTDSDCILSIDYVESIIHSTRNKFDVISGKIDLFCFNERFSIYEYYDVISSLRQEAYSKLNFGATANLVVHKTVFEKVGGFEILTSGGDHRFCEKANKLGYNFAYNENISVRHPARNSYQSLILKARRVNKGKAEAILKEKQFLFQVVIKNIIGLFVQLNQWKLIYKVTLDKSINYKFKLKMFFLIMEIGFTARIHFFKTILKKDYL